MIPTRIYLIGYMGAGKSTLGKLLAETLSYSFIDLDFYIEQRFHRSVNQLFAEHSEEGFRKIEQRLLQEVSDFENTIIATGGGTPCFFDNIEVMNRSGLTIYLENSPETLFARLRIAGHSRPLIKEKNDTELRSFITETLARREPYYQKAHLIFNANQLDTRTDIQHSLQQLCSLIQER